MDSKTKTLLGTVGVIVFMGAMAWASVPLYTWFCQVTGYGGTTNVAEAGADEILDRTVKVRFDATTEKGMPWEFAPVDRTIEIKIGETGLAFYEAYNPTDRPVAGQASYNVTPFYAGEYFSKIDCFCFTEQILQPGERVQMPVSFYVDPAIVEDRDAKYVKQITLSYTFYEIDLPEEERQANLTTN
ncbi:cytochrome c oxidase assembly protein [Palleronia abyssalis]|uniref:Cytochrome c oxidase assembly protein CtaG n=1 Tax=Palleronia abyssalis TaxID=1501240 RepID=A0A2R8BX76_9RHOB|nr:cytochrome c oxidase assembly protein [Palleronia abyssalis]SPJ24777.1 Cytochrome c oxidase assembly protein CtaG [Palleronia abyssalis]